MTLQPPDVVGPGEVLKLLDIGREAFRRHHKTRPDFPPAQHLECGDVYERRAIVAYAKQRETGKPYLSALAMWRRLHVAAALSPSTVQHTIGAELGVSATTVRRYLQQLGEIPR